MAGTDSVFQREVDVAGELKIPRQPPQVLSGLSPFCNSSSSGPVVTEEVLLPLESASTLDLQSSMLVLVCVCFSTLRPIQIIMLVIITSLHASCTQSHRLEVPPNPVDSCLLLEKLDEELDLELLGPAPPP